MRDGSTAFPDLLARVAPDPERIEYDKLNKQDPRTAAAVFPPPDVPDPEIGSPPPPENPRRGPESYPESAIYKEHGFRWRARQMNALSPDIVIVEIARWHAPSGHLGIISHIATHIGVATPTDDADPNSPIIEFGIDVPPLPWLHDVLFYDPLWDRDPLRWWLRLESQREREELAPVTLRGRNELPGQPFPELATWTDQRFGWNWHGREPLRLLVPEGHTARLFVGLDLDPEPLGGALAAKSSVRKLAIDTSAPAVRRLLNVIAPGSGSSPTSSGEAVALEPRAMAFDERDRGLALAGRLIGTIQTYRESRLATEAARRGL